MAISPLGKIGKFSFRIFHFEDYLDYFRYASTFKNNLYLILFNYDDLKPYKSSLNNS